MLTPLNPIRPISTARATKILASQIILLTAVFRDSTWCVSRKQPLVGQHTVNKFGLLSAFFFLKYKTQSSVWKESPFRKEVAEAIFFRLIT